MTKAKTVAKTIKGTVVHPVVTAIQDRAASVDKAIEEVLGYWSYDLYSRKPGPAYSDEGVFVGTDLDMAAFLFALSDRKAVINLPEYKGMRQATTKVGERVLSSENRHGQLLSVVSNKDTFIFSIRVKDMNVITSDTVGAYRNFSLTKFDGGWYSGWGALEFMPSAQENEFITKSGILSDNSIQFTNFVHPNRWTSFYGQYYFITKMLIDRLTDEAAHYNKLIKEMKVALNYVSEPAFPESEPAGEKKSIKVQAFHAEIDFPEMTGEYAARVTDLETLEYLMEKRKYWVYNLIPRLRFMCRATEYAFKEHVNSKGLNVFPSWMKNMKWEEDYVQKGKRTKWNRLVCFQPAVGKQGVSIRFRQWEKSEQVDINYEG